MRAFVEEAAGVSHYKDIRLESERHLKISEENLQQIEHLSAEIDKRVGALKDKRAQPCAIRSWASKLTN